MQDVGLRLDLTGYLNMIYYPRWIRCGMGMDAKGTKKTRIARSTATIEPQRHRGRRDDAAGWASPPYRSDDGSQDGIPLER
jgi:hypothetical protein